MRFQRMVWTDSEEVEEEWDMQEATVMEAEMEELE